MSERYNPASSSCEHFQCSNCGKLLNDKWVNIVYGKIIYVFICPNVRCIIKRIKYLIKGVTV